MAEPTNTYEATTRMTDVNGFPIHTNEAGSGPVLFGFHGGGPGANAWDNSKHNIDALAEHFHVILMDMPGFGHSTKDSVIKEGETLDRANARIIREFMDVRGIEKANLYGSSQSGPACMRFGLEYPDRTLKIVLQASGPGGPNWFTPSPPQGIQALGVFQNEPTYENMTAMMRNFVPDAKLLTDDMIQARFDAAMIPGHLEARARIATVRNSDLRMEIGRLQAEVLVVWGNQDRMVPMEGALGALAAIPKVRVHLWGGVSGHFVEYEHADEFNRLVIDFLTH
ncbi:MAG: alpha/beta fold hydrolase [Dehalococcoidia bacterium]